MKRFTFRPVKTSIIGTIAGLALFQTYPAFSGLSESARDWYVTCNDNNYCIAETSGTSADDPDMQFKLERSNKPNGKVFVTISPSLKLGLGMRVEIDVLGLDYGVFGEIKKIYKGNEMAFSGDARRELIQKLREGRKAQILIDFGGDIGTVIYKVSLSGVSTALMLMDEAQQRLDRVDAAIAWGGEPADSLSIAREPVGDEVVGEDGHEDQSEKPVQQASGNVIIDEGIDTSIGSGSRYYTAADLPDAVAMPGFKTYQCDMETPMEGFGAIGLGMGNGHALYMVPCQMGDVNIEHYIAMLGPKHGNFANTYEFETPPDFNQPNRSTIINPDYDPDTMKLFATTYHSPNYDCGIYETHQYVEEEDFFELIEFREKSSCDGKNTLPENFPLVWTIDEMGQ
ncbi:MAG: DUF1176 domain-containing protein [Pseudomonadota bacterium]